MVATGRTSLGGRRGGTIGQGMHGRHGAAPRVCNGVDQRPCDGKIHPFVFPFSSCSHIMMRACNPLLCGRLVTAQVAPTTTPSAHKCDDWASAPSRRLPSAPSDSIKFGLHSKSTHCITPLSPSPLSDPHPFPAIPYSQPPHTILLAPATHATPLPVLPRPRPSTIQPRSAHGGSQV